VVHIGGGPQKSDVLERSFWSVEGWIVSGDRTWKQFETSHGIVEPSWLSDDYEEESEESGNISDNLEHEPVDKVTQPVSVGLLN